MSIGVYSGAQMKALDSYAIEKCGISGLWLMENAAKCIVEELQKRVDLTGKTCVIVCGKGNNGGDGFAAATLLATRCKQVRLVCMAQTAALSQDAAHYSAVADRYGIERIAEPEAALDAIAQADVIIDALYGFGFRGALSAADAELVRAINQANAYVVAADIPSGIGADSGAFDLAVQADLTVTFTGYKLSATLFESRECYGEIAVANIGIPADAKAQCAPMATLVLPQTVRDVLGKRKRNAHKGDYGKVFTLGGSRGMSGAVYLSTQAALRCGAGLVCAGVPECLMDIMEVKTTEAMSFAVREAEGGLCRDTAAVEKANTYQSVAFGMGAGRTSGVADMLSLLLAQGETPMVIDADGLFALTPEMLVGQKRPIVLTPHSGEMARLCGKSIQEVEADRIGVAKEFAMRYAVCVVLKGAHTVIAAPDGRVAINCLVGNSGMATAGSGDVLSGICALMLARCTDAFSAAQAAVYLHGLAGDLAADEKGEDGMLAGDIAEMLPYAIQKLRQTE